MYIKPWILCCEWSCDLLVHFKPAFDCAAFTLLEEGVDVFAHTWPMITGSQEFHCFGLSNMSAHGLDVRFSNEGLDEDVRNGNAVCNALLLGCPQPFDEFEDLAVEDVSGCRTALGLGQATPRDVVREWSKQWP